MFMNVAQKNIPACIIPPWNNYSRHHPWVQMRPGTSVVGNNSWTMKMCIYVTKACHLKKQRKILEGFIPTMFFECSPVKKISKNVLAPPCGGIAHCSAYHIPVATTHSFLSCLVLIYFPSSAKDAQHMADVENCKLQFRTPPPIQGWGLFTCIN